MTEAPRILIVEDDAAMRAACLDAFAAEGFPCSGVATAAEALASLDAGPPPGIVVTDLRLPGLDGLGLLREIKARDATIEVVLMTGYGTIQSAVEAMKDGAGDYLTKPFELDALLVVVKRLARMRELELEVRRLRTELKDRYRFANIVGQSPAMREVFELTRAAAECESPVLIEGDSGTGKELVARAIHYEGLRAKGPFVPVNCSALPTELIESELFGHRRGAFTGAHREQGGLFLAAHGGTIFLDEITEMPLQAQSKLLRVLEDKQVRPVGAVENVPVDVRVLAASNRPFAGALEEGALREDLFYRLGVILISVPPLRRRTSDIPALAMHFIERFNDATPNRIEGISPEALDLLQRYAWPGNVRELRNVIEGVFATGQRGRIEAEHLPGGLRQTAVQSPPAGEDVAVPTLQEAEGHLVRAALRATRGNKSEAARLLGISRSRLYHVIRLHRIRV